MKTLKIVFLLFFCGQSVCLFAGKNTIWECAQNKIVHHCLSVLCPSGLTEATVEDPSSDGSKCIFSEKPASLRPGNAVTPKESLTEIVSLSPVTPSEASFGEPELPVCSN